MTIGVLLPLRLETRFTGNRLRLRVIPDEPWLDRHDPLPSAAELDSLDRYRAAADGQPPESPAALAAWRSLASQHGPGRAAWLLRAHLRPAESGGRNAVHRPAALREDFRFTELSSFPETLEVWLARGGRSPTPAAVLEVNPSLLGLDLPDPDVPGDARWWQSWDLAVRAGLAVELDLGDNPNDIDALYVVGHGSNAPDRLFTAHRDAGRLRLLEPGTPTNTVDGRPAAGLAADAWLEALSRPTNQPEQLVSQALTGDPDRLGALPGRVRPVQVWTRRLAAGLWPALWGQPLADVAGLGPAAAPLAEWASANVEPLGPYSTLLIGDQPYGLLPVTSLATWRTAPGDPPIELAARGILRTLSAQWADAAQRRGNAEGASTERMLELLAQPPISPGYAIRRMWPMELWYLALLGTNHRIPWRGLLNPWEARHPLANQLGMRHRRRYGSRGFAKRLRLPLITPPGLPPSAHAGTVMRALARLAAETPTVFADTRTVEPALGLPTGSLLLRLAVRSLQLAIGDVGRAKRGITEATLEPVAADQDAATRLGEWIRAVAPADLAAESPAAQAFQRVAAGIDNGIRVPAEVMELMLPAVIDCASHRVDPWVTAPARRRLRTLLRAREPLRLGAYGWVDRPRPGTPGPTALGLLVAPSERQARTAALLRDRFTRDPEPQRWHMDITSATARGAARLAEEVRRGAHLAEALGREVERAVARPEHVARLRRDFPIRAAHAGRRVCHGQRVLAADPATLDLPPAALARLAELRATVDAYGDLLVAEAVGHAVDGQPASAGAALDAAAGLAQPPELAILRTRGEGRAVQTGCAILLPAVAGPTLPDDPGRLAEVDPAVLAEPSAAAFLADQVDPPVDWRWTVARAVGPPVEINLADLGLSVPAALALPLGDLERLVLQAAGIDRPAVTNRGGSQRYDRAVRLVALLGRAPATAEDVGETGEPAAGPGAPRAVAIELHSRYEALRAVAATLADRIERAADAGERAAVLQLAAAWGIAPAPDPGSGDPLADQAVRAGVLLRDRLAATPDPQAAAAFDHRQLAAAMAELASATGQLAVLARLARSALPDGLAPAGAGDPGAPAGGFDTAWLRLVAPVREPLARLEAAQLAAGTPAGGRSALAAWTNRPADPWQRDSEDPRRLVAAYAPAGFDLRTVPAETALAAALVDQFTETIPGTNHTAAAAFGFDAPAARAPQAILLAVPPDPDRPLDATTLVQIVAETRELARARATTLADVGDTTGLLPLPVLPVSGETAVPLDHPA